MFITDYGYTCIIVRLASIFSLGMLHDGQGNHCEAIEGSIMAPTLFGADGVFKWSACSRKYLNKFLR